MNLEEIVAAVDGRVLIPPVSDDLDVSVGFASDLMSDVLHLVKANTLLITGLTNVQTIRTAEIADLPVVLFVRDKQPPKETLDLAKKIGIAVILTPFTMFESCGLLYQAGLQGQGAVRGTASGR